jgi:putative solute:sodium symporter small subunit
VYFGRGIGRDRPQFTRLIVRILMRKEHLGHDIDSPLAQNSSITQGPGEMVMPENDFKTEYWKKNLKYLAILLSIWFVVSYGFGIILVDQLDKIRIGGFKLGFWFSQQGSILVFVILIFVYVRLMNKLDRQFREQEKKETQQ